MFTGILQVNVYQSTSLAQIEEAGAKGTLVKAEIQIKKFLIFRYNYDDYN